MKGALWIALSLSAGITKYIVFGGSQASQSTLYNTIKCTVE